MIEALIDFGEGEEIEEGVYDQGLFKPFSLVTYIDRAISAQERARKLRDTIQNHLSDNRRGEILRSGIRLTIFGPPNAGKSSLLNFLGRLLHPNPI